MKEVILELEDAGTNLYKQHKLAIQKGIALAAGSMQVATGVAIDYSTFGIGAVFGAMLIGHGINNMYEENKK